MSLYEDTNPRRLRDLLGEIHSGSEALPDFQRDFVWDAGATQELVVSVANNYPAGSILRIRNTKNLFASREVQAAPPLVGQRPTYLILDGQQRLTSLYQAFWGVGDHRYFLRIGELLDGKDFEECIFHLRATHRTVGQYAGVPAQASELVMPLGALKDGAGGFLSWAVRVAQNRGGGDQGMEFLKTLTADVGERWIQNISEYQFPVVTLSDETDADAVCTILRDIEPHRRATERFRPSYREILAPRCVAAPVVGTSQK